MQKRHTCVVILSLFLLILPTGAQEFVGVEPFAIDDEDFIENITFIGLPEDIEANWSDIQNDPDNFAVRIGNTPVIMPDGRRYVTDARVVQRDSRERGYFMCIITRAESSVACSLLPVAEDDWAVFHPSPNGRYVAFTQAGISEQIEPDLFIFDTETGEIINRTEDNIGEQGFADIENSPFDMIPTWHPEGDLYFFRYENWRSENPTLNLFRIVSDDLMSDTPPELIRHLDPVTGNTFSTRHAGNFDILARMSAISPDGSRLAFTVQVFGDQDTTLDGIWIVNLDDDSPPYQLFDSGTFYDSADLPQQINEPRLLLSGLSWASDDKLVVASTVVIENAIVEAGHSFGYVNTVLQYDFVNETLESYINYDNLFISAPHYEPANPAQVVASAVLLPDGSLLYFSDNALEIWHVESPGTRPQMIVSGANILISREQIASIGEDGNTVYVNLAGNLLTIEMD